MNFNLYSKYYDLLYSDKNYKSESLYVLDLIEKYKSSTINSVIELGSGTGNHVQYYASSFKRVHGLERSAEMVNISMSKSILNFTPLVRDISNFDLSIKFDAAISLFHVISYLNSNEEILSCFKSVFNSLNDNGLFIFDVWYTPAVFTLKPETRVKRWDTKELTVTRFAESLSNNSNNVVEVNYDIHILNKLNNSYFNVKEKHPMRHFSLPEVKLFAKISGFDVVAAEEFLTGSTPSEYTWGVCFILKKTHE
jgi:SAM-dependent methyltransferase